MVKVAFVWPFSYLVSLLGVRPKEQEAVVMESTKQLIASLGKELIG